MAETEHTGNPSARQRLLELARRCETEEPSRDLDAEIAVACKIIRDFDESIYIVPLIWRAQHGEVHVGRYLKGAWWPEAVRKPARFSSSLDAAVTLVPEGVSWIAHVTPRQKPYGAVGTVGTRAKTPALALCAGALRALAQEAE